jgi:pimeloyl-ACP methyl ester carboxylesterase
MSQNMQFKEYGEGTSCVFVLSPVMPVWDEGAFIKPLTEHFLSAGYRVVVFDSLSLPVVPQETLKAFSKRWARALQPWGVPSVLVGVALGGALALELVSTLPIASTPALLLLSSPAKANALLDARLGRMAELADMGEVEEAKRLLDALVLPEGAGVQAVSESLGSTSLVSQGERLARGFRLLAGIDLSESLRQYQGRVLNIFGEQSQLVSRLHVIDTPSVNQHTLCISGGGMRPLADDLGAVLKAVDRFLPARSESAA